MEKEIVLKAFTLANIVDIISQEEFEDVKKAIKEQVAEDKLLKNNWSVLKEWLEQNWEETHDIWYVKIINKMKYPPAIDLKMRLTVVPYND